MAVCNKQRTSVRSSLEISLLKNYCGGGPGLTSIKKRFLTSSWLRFTLNKNTNIFRAFIMFKVFYQFNFYRYIMKQVPIIILKTQKKLGIS